MKKDFCKTHNEPKNIITGQYGKVCMKCYLEITKKKKRLIPIIKNRKQLGLC